MTESSRILHRFGDVFPSWETCHGLIMVILYRYTVIVLDKPQVKS
jgi:hypothetical protein